MGAVSTTEIISYLTEVNLVEKETLEMTNFTMTQLDICAIIEVQFSSYYREAIDLGQSEKSRLPRRYAMLCVY